MLQKAEGGQLMISDAVIQERVAAWFQYDKCRAEAGGVADAFLYELLPELEHVFSLHVCSVAWTTLSCMMKEAPNIEASFRIELGESDELQMGPPRSQKQLEKLMGDCESWPCMFLCSPELAGVNHSFESYSLPVDAASLGLQIPDNCIVTYSSAGLPGPDMEFSSNLRIYYQHALPDVP
jgi:hypothetical protein